MIIIIAIVVLIISSLLSFLNIPKETVTDWSECDKDCGGGNRFKYCTKSSILFPKKVDCGTIQEPCNSHECPIDGKLSEWSDWSTCPTCATQDTHKRKRNRTYTPPKFKGKNPDGYTILEQEDNCADLVPCPITIIPSMLTIVGIAPEILSSTNTKDIKVTNKHEEPLYTLTNTDLDALDVKEILVYTNKNSVDESNKINHILYEFNTIKNGDYSVSMKNKSKDTKSDSWFIKIDNGEWFIWFAKVDEKWIWNTYPEVFKLTKGPHKIYLAPRDKGAALNILKIDFSK